MAAKKKKNIVVDPGPQITVDNILQINKDFMEAAKKNQDITIKTKSVDNIDLAGIQFIAFAKKHAEKSKISLTLDLKVNDTAEDLLKSSGFNNLLSM